MARETIEHILLCEKLRLRMSPKEIKTLLDGLEKEGKVDSDELLQKVGRGPKWGLIKKAMVQRDVIRKQFDHWDKDQKGYISKEELKTVLQNRISSNISEDEVTKMMESVDNDGDGKVDFEEFLKAFSYMKFKE